MQIQQNSKDFSMQDIIGREEWKASFYSYLLGESEQEEFGISLNRLFLFLGKNGNGKQTLASAFAQLMKQNGYVCQVLYADEIEGETREQTRKLLQQFVSKQETAGDCFVILKNLDEIEDSYALKMLLRSLDELQNRNHKFICVATAQKMPDTLPELQCFEIICLKEPNKEERRQYLESAAQSSASFSSTFDLEEAVKITEGFTFGNLQSAVQLAKKLAIGQAKMNQKINDKLVPVAITRSLFQRAAQLIGKVETEKLPEPKVVPEFQTIQTEKIQSQQTHQEPEVSEQTHHNLEMQVQTTDNDHLEQWQTKKLVLDEDGNITMDNDLGTVIDLL